MTVNTIPAYAAQHSRGQRHLRTSHNQQDRFGFAQQNIFNPAKNVGPTGWRCRASLRKPRLDLVVPNEAVAVDCEGQTLPDKKAIHGGIGLYVNGLGRVSAVRQDSKLIYDTFVFYPIGIRTSRSAPWRGLGVKNADVREENGAQPLEKVLKDLRDIFDKSELVVGHDMENEMRYTRGLDEKTLKVPVAGVDWSKYKVRDTQAYSEYYYNGQKSGLAKLSSRVLELDIQGKIHSSIEDAKATMALYMRRKSQIDVEQANLRFDPFRTGAKGAINQTDLSDFENQNQTDEEVAFSGTPSPEQTASPGDSGSSNPSLSPVTSSARTSPNASPTQSRPVACGTKLALPDIPGLAKGRRFDRKTSTYIG